MPDSANDAGPRRGLINSTSIGLGVLALALIASLVQVMRTGRELSGTDGAIVLRICHWQLEDGYRDALQMVIVRRYKLA